MVKTDKRSAAIFWSGGKNSALVLSRALEDETLDIRCLITLHAEEDPAHPLSEIFVQSAKLGLPLQLIPLSEGESLDAALQTLVERYKLDLLIAGDVEVHAELSAMIDASAANLGVELQRPLLNGNRFHLLSEMIEREIVARITWLGHSSLPQEWLGRELDVRLIADLARFTDVDLSGENGEYHTMVDIL